MNAFIKVLLRSFVMDFQIQTARLAFYQLFCTGTKYINQNVNSDLSQL